MGMGAAMDEIPDTMPHGKPLRIAVADDEVELRAFYGRVLPHLGHEVVAVAVDGEELVQVCVRVRVDLIISDVQLAGLSGPEAVTRIRRQHPVAAVYVTGRPLEDVAAANAKDAVVLAKPFRMSDLIPAIKEAMAMLPDGWDGWATAPEWS